MLDLYGTFGVFGEPFEKLAEAVRDLMQDWQAIEVEIKEKKKYKPILKLSPNKTYIRDKKLIKYYCRDNC